jgi:hypothetical protein
MDNDAGLFSVFCWESILLSCWWRFLPVSFGTHFPDCCGFFLLLVTNFVKFLVFTAADSFKFLVLLSVLVSFLDVSLRKTKIEILILNI